MKVMMFLLQKTSSLSYFYRNAVLIYQLISYIRG